MGSALYGLRHRGPCHRERHRAQKCPILRVVSTYHRTNMGVFALPCACLAEGKNVLCQAIEQMRSQQAITANYSGQMT